MSGDIYLSTSATDRCESLHDGRSITQTDLRSFGGEDNQDVLTSRGSALSNKMRDTTTLHSLKQQIWLRTALCRGCCRHMVLCNLTLACQKWRRRHQNSLTFNDFQQRLKHIYLFEWDMSYLLLCIIINIMYVCMTYKDFLVKCRELCFPQVDFLVPRGRHNNVLRWMKSDRIYWATVSNILKDTRPSFCTPDATCVI